MITVPISIGEALDKLCILQIKTERIFDTSKLNNIQNELVHLTNTVKNHRHPELEAKLKQINEALWTIEDKLREAERNQAFDDKFIDLARSVYTLNDARAEIKRQINLVSGSKLIEEKSYS